MKNGVIEMMYVFFFQHRLISVRVAVVAAQDLVATHHGPPPLSTFCLVEVPNQRWALPHRCRTDGAEPVEKRCGMEGSEPSKK